MLILAGVSINLVLGPNGLITKAQEAALKTDESQEKEGIEMAISSSKMEDVNTLEISKTNLEKALKEQFGNNKDFTVTDNGDGSFLINMNDTKRSYYIESTGDIIDESNMIKIGTAEELKAFRDDVNSGNTYEGKYVYLTTNIVLDNTLWTPIGKEYHDLDEKTPTFNGIFDGKGYEIDGMVINDNSLRQGFFGYVKNGVIKNLGIGENSTIRCEKNSGGVVALADMSKIINCYSKANIEGTASSIGGVAGVLKNNSEVINCYNVGSVSGGTINVGGVVGNSMKSKILNCYNTGSVVAIKPGGITGQSLQGSSVKNCYNIGNITKLEGITYVDYSHYGIVAGIDEEAEINNCYYLDGSVNNGNDIDKCEGVLNKSPEELKSLSTILGESFKEDTNNINNGYPILTWQ